MCRSNLRDLFQMRVQFLLFPKLAVACRMANVVPLEGEAGFSSDANRAFGHYFLSLERVEVSFFQILWVQANWFVIHKGSRFPGAYLFVGHGFFAGDHAIFRGSAFDEERRQPCGRRWCSAGERWFSCHRGSVSRRDVN